ncbi:hypothetical protein AK88_00830 [Plasmodium fragile]|uniref:HIT-type domain-containing protein n=1 Tax=Plasmodium fragile TaxID=5857 RepID=A0A0D9QRG4_PLAFR|nr:uncharacterized protein AK88_00830 [Plasmodium fragile]XP_012334819.1 uncharacterized protein AK88_01761 [Plasmodium fragile]KJP88681.1 hypothetical protein AK88_01761 [Plasmodium fragile]KJP89387.1 hypothetical protein AK88_00830 [Plasmodium fragile]
MRKTCQVCKQKLYQYVCPSCEIVYCSLECYKKHNDECVHNFLDNQVKENIKNNQLTDLDKREFKFKLRKFYEQGGEGAEQEGEDEDDEEVADGEEAGIGDEEEDAKTEAGIPDEDVADEKVADEEIADEAGSDAPAASPGHGHLKKWCISNKRYKVLTELAKSDQLKLDHLTQTEQKQFFSFLKSNDMNAYLEKFQPWWLNCVIKKVPTPEHICCNKRVSENVKFMIIEMVYSYCYLLRIFNESLDGKELCYCLLYMASSLNRFNLPESNVYNTVNNLFQRILENDEIAREKGILYNVITDVTIILKLKDLLLRCLYETKKFFKKQIKKMNCKKDKMDSSVSGTKKMAALLQEEKHFKYVNKKITFLCSYANYHYDVFDSVTKQLERFYSEQSRGMALASNEKREIVLSKEMP